MLAKKRGHSTSRCLNVAMSFPVKGCWGLAGATIAGRGEDKGGVLTPHLQNMEENEDI